MTLTFKQFATYLAAPDDASPAQLDEIWDRILGKKKADKEAEENEDDDKKTPSSGQKVLTRKELDDKRKELAAKRKKELEDKRNQAWAASKERVESGRKGGIGSHRSGEYAWHSSHMKESMPLTERANRKTFRKFGDWKAAAKSLDLDKADVSYLKTATEDDGRDHNLASPEGVIVAKWSQGRKEGWVKASLNEGKQSYSDQSYWKDDAKEAGYKVKKLSGNLMDGDQTWGAFKDDKKMGEFTEKEEGRGGWLITE